MKKDDKIIGACFIALWIGGTIGGYSFRWLQERLTAPTAHVTVNFTFTNANPQNVKGLTTAATELLQKKGVLPGFKQ